MSTCLPQKSSLLWQIVSLCLRVYNQESLLLWQIFSLCLRWKISLLWQIFSLRQHEFLSTYLHVYNNKVAFSGRFWVCVFVSTAKKLKSSFLWQIANLCQHVYNKKIPSLTDSQFVSTCLHVFREMSPFSADYEFVSTCLQPTSSLLWQILGLCLCVCMSTAKKFPSLTHFQFVSTCSQWGITRFLGHNWRSRRYVFGIFFSLIGLNLGIWMQF